MIKTNTSSKVYQAIIIARVSSREQERGESISAQIKSCEDYCEKNNIPILKIYPITESSTKKERKKFREVLQFIRSYKDKLIVVANTIDRIQRHFREYIDLDDLRTDNKIELHFIREHLKITNKSNSYEIGSWIQGVAWGQQYVMQSSDNIKRANDECRNKGRWLHQAPFGYKNYTDETGLANVCIDPTTGPIVKKLLQEYATGNYSLNGLAHLATKLGLKNKSGRPLDKNQIARMIRNPFYYGVMKTIDVYRPHMHGNLISKELYDRIQDVIHGVEKPSFTRQSDTFALSGIVFCGTCGSLMTPERHTKKNGKSYTYLKCSHYHSYCRQAPVNEIDILDQIQAEIFDKLHIDKDTLALIQKEVHKNIEKDKEEELLRKKQTEMQLAEIEVKKGKCADLVMNGVYTEDVFQKQMLKLAQNEMELRQLLKEQSLVDVEINEMVDCVLDFAANAGFYFKSSKIPEKQQILKLLVSNSTINEKKLAFSMNYPFNELIKNTSSSNWWAIRDSNSGPAD